LSCHLAIELREAAARLLLAQPPFSVYRMGILDLRRFRGPFLIDTFEAFSPTESLPDPCPDGATLYLTPRPLILYRASLSPHRRNFTIAHELGHLCLGHRAPTSAAERRADAFAAVLLMPPAVILACEAMLRRPLTVGEMLSAFNVSSSAALRMRRQLTAAPPLRFSAAERELVRRLMGRATQGNPPFPDR